MNNDVKHSQFLSRFASHLFSPSVIKCSACGTSFITDEEILNIKNGKKVNFENIKKRKCSHFQEFNYTKENMGFNETTNICAVHKIVRIICKMDKYKDLERPNKEIILEELNYIKKINIKSRGNVYINNLVEYLIKVTWDFLQRRKNLNEEQKKKLSNDIISFEDRVIIEVNEPQDDYINSEATYDGLTKEEIESITPKLDLIDFK